MQVPFFRHQLDSSWGADISAVLDTPFLTSAGVGRQVEGQLCDFFGLSHAFLTSSWTSGAIATLLALDIGPGCEVIVPAMTFIATANVVELVGARPVFADIDPQTLLLTPQLVASALTPATRAVIVAHLYGQMVDMAGIRAVLAHRPDVALIEDAAHCFEGTRDGDPPGRWSDAAIFSFYATKNVTCGEGGAIITRDAKLAEAIGQTRIHGMTAAAVDRFHASSYRHWDMERLGTKANMPDLLAALLPRQIASIRERLEQRHILAERYRQAFADTGLRLPRWEAGICHAQHLFPIWLPLAVRDQALSVLGENGVGVTVNYRAVPHLSWYAGRYPQAAAQCPEAYRWGEGTLSLPFYPAMTDEQQTYVINVVRRSVLPLID